MIQKNSNSKSKKFIKVIINNILELEEEHQLTFSITM